MKVSKEASITVEACYVLPIVFGTIFAIIYLCFALHDRCVIQDAVDQALSKASPVVRHEGDFSTGQIAYERINERGVYSFIADHGEIEQLIEQQIEHSLTNELSKGLFLLKINFIEASLSWNRIRIESEFEMKISIPMFRYLFKSFSKIMITQTSDIHNPAETIRAAEVILETGSKIKGMNQWLDSIRK